MTPSAHRCCALKNDEPTPGAKAAAERIEDIPQRPAYAVRVVVPADADADASISVRMRRNAFNWGTEIPNPPRPRQRRRLQYREVLGLL
jgi:hypothetical protein